MDRHRGDRFSDRSGDRFSDRSGDRPGDRSGDGGRHSRMPSRWSSDSPTSQSHRYPRGGGEGFSGGRHHPYRGPSQDYAVGGGGGPGFRGGPSGFSHQMPISEQKRGIFGRGDSPEHTDGNKFAKLFIGSVPRTTTEEDIRPLFEEHGDVIEVALIKDRRTGEQQGCCFIKYATAEEADRAIRALHNQYTLPGGSGPIQVRYADGERESLVEHKLFVASLNKQATEKEIEEIFSPYGRVEDVYLMRDDMRQSRGCGFVKFSNREMASAAMNALNGIYVMRGCDQPLIVRFANPKRPRPGEQRGGPAFGGPGFGPRSEASTVIRPQSNLDESMGGSLRPNAWDQMSSQSLVPSSQTSHHGFANHPSGKDVATSSATPGTLGVPAGPTNGSLPSVATSSSSLQQCFNPSMAHIYSSVGQQILPLQKLLMSPQDLPPSVQLHHTQQILASHSQAQTLQAPMQQLNQFQIPQSVGLPSSQTLPSQQLHGLGGQLSASQPLIQQNASAVALQAPLGGQQQGMPAVANHQQFPSSTTSQQLLQQPIQQFPSQFPQVLLQQQAQALQSSYQSSQQAIMQMQQQLHQMQQGSQTVKHQSPWTGQQSTSSAPATTTQAAVMPSTVTTSVASTCNWTEHTSPEGFKYYYNSVTRESKWEKPEELTLFEQQQKLLLLQQQQQKIAAQQLPSPSNRQIQPPQQVPQTHEVQAQMQARQQAQLQLLQPSLTYQASGVAGHQNIQDSYYTQLQAASSVIDPARVQQGIQAAQEWAWKNKPAGS